MRLKGKVAIVTGGGADIGRAISYAFAAEGAIVVAAARNFSRINEVAEDIRGKRGDARAIQTDISSESQVINMVKETMQQYGRIDILVNNSGIPGPTGKIN